METLSKITLHYSRPAPRYNTYPLIPFWKNNLSQNQWINSCRQSLQKKNKKISLYIHIPFCETLCSFCVCNTYITKDHALEEVYLKWIHKEFAYYCQEIPELDGASLVQLHIGGGTPNFFSPKNLSRLLQNILKKFSIPKLKSFSWEADLRHLSFDHLKILYELGFKEISFGIEDFDPKVQRIINKVQSPKQLELAHENALKIGYDCIRYDLIYGLPYQNIASIKKSIKKTLEYKPNRIAYYPYIHSPENQKSPRLFNTSDLPLGNDRHLLYTSVNEYIKKASYSDLAMGYYVLENDPLQIAKKNNCLVHNLLGYSALETNLILGLGTSAISESMNAYHKNEKILKKYQSQDSKQNKRTHKLSQKDLEYRAIIRSLFTQEKTTFSNNLLKKIYKKWEDLEKHAFIKYDKYNKLILSTEASPFIANLCLDIDYYVK